MSRRRVFAAAVLGGTAALAAWNAWSMAAAYGRDVRPRADEMLVFSALQYEDELRAEQQASQRLGVLIQGSTNTIVVEAGPRGDALFLAGTPPPDAAAPAAEGPPEDPPAVDGAVEGPAVDEPEVDELAVAAFVEDVVHAQLGDHPPQLEPALEAPTKVIVLTSQRSGSTYLCAALAHRLWGRGFVTWTEPLIPSQWVLHGWAPEAVRTAFGWDVAAAWPLYEQRLDEAFREALKLHQEAFPTRPAEVLGFKVMDNQVPQPLWPHFLEYLARHDVRVVQLNRLNALEIFLSKADAVVKGSWHSYDRAPGAAEEVVRHAVHLPHLHNELFLHSCTNQNIAKALDALPAGRTTLLAYENLQACEEAELAGLLEFLGIAPAAARGADVVDGKENWVKAYVPTKLVATAPDADVCAGRIENWDEVARFLEGSLELRLCAHPWAGLGPEEVDEGLNYDTRYGEKERLECGENSTIFLCGGQRSTVHGCVEHMLRGAETAEDGEAGAGGATAGEEEDGADFEAQ